MFIPNFTNLHQNCYQSKSIPIQSLHNPKTIQSHPIEQFPTLNPSTSLLILPNPIPYLPPEEKTSRCLLQNNTKSIKSAPKHHDSTSQQTIISSTLFSLITNPRSFSKTHLLSYICKFNTQKKLSNKTPNCIQIN